MKVSLLVFFGPIRMPSHPRRKQLAHLIAQSHMYLDLVNWHHKVIRSDSTKFISLTAGDDVFKELTFLSSAEHVRSDISGNG